MCYKMYGVGGAVTQPATKLGGWKELMVFGKMQEVSSDESGEQFAHSV